MEDFPASYVAISRPLLILSGLTRLPPTSTSSKILSSRGPKISSESPPVEGERANLLLAEFLAFDGGGGHNAARPSSNQSRAKSFRIRAVGRDYTLPRRKGISSGKQSPPTSPSGRETSSELHSPISPLSRASPLFPDGLMTPSWPEKHQEILPAAFVSFFSMSSNPEYDSLNDNLLKSEINAVKGSLTDSQHRTRFIAVLVADESTLQDNSVEERVENIRKSTKLDSKSSFFVLPFRADASELSSFVLSLLTAVRPSCVTYYNELAKHARRKERGASSPPPPLSTPGLARHLDNRGWNVRYAYKQAIFFEFNAEVDSASRHFEVALSSLLDPGGILGSQALSSWSPRWNEARLFADTIAIRHIRCLLSNGYPTAAVRAHKRHHSRVQALIIHDGKPTQSYSWRAWESRWARCMAQLVSECGDLAIDSNAKKLLEPIADIGRAVYVMGEKPIPAGEKAYPWDRLHHSGYWFKISADRSRDRRKLAQEIPEDDRVPPNQSPATSVARRFEKYDTYLCSEPHAEYVSATGKEHVLSNATAAFLRQAAEVFSTRTQQCMADFVQLSAAKELLASEQYESARPILAHLWQSNQWRQNGWYTLLRTCAIDLYTCAKALGDVKIQLTVLWELLNCVFEPSDLLSYQVFSSLPDQETHESSTMHLELHDDQIISFIEASVLFSFSQGYVGEPCVAELRISSHAHGDAPSIVLSDLTIAFEDLLPPVCISHKQHAHGEDELATPANGPLNLTVNLNEDERSADLTLRPRDTLALNITLMPPSAPGILKASTLTVHLRQAHFDLKHVVTLNRRSFSAKHGELLGSIKSHPLKRSSEVEVLPKPPKVFVDVANVRNRYYTNEFVLFHIQIENKESQSAFISLDLKFTSREGEPVENSLWMDGQSTPDQENSPNGILKLQLGRLPAGEQYHEHRVSLRAPSYATECVFELTTTYYLEDDSENLITKSTRRDLEICKPFEARFSVRSAVHPQSWPSFFDLTRQSSSSTSTDTEDDTGVVMRWSLRSNITSMAEEELSIERFELAVLSTENLESCRIVEISTNPSSIPAGGTKEVQFALDVSKSELVHSKNLTMNTSLIVYWRRSDALDDEMAATAVEVPSLVLPCNEPRVLARLNEQLSLADENTLGLELVLENPSLHFLSFAVSLESSDAFVYSGSRAATIHCLPYSRSVVQYLIFPLERGTFIYVRAKVLDTHFNKSLHIHATDHLKLDHHGIRIWVE